MVEITVFNLSGLYMGPVAQIASMLVYPINDNLVTSRLLERALKEVEKIDDDYSFSQEQSSHIGMREDAPEWRYSKASSSQEKKTPSHIKIVDRSSETEE